VDALEETALEGLAKHLDAAESRDSQCLAVKGILEGDKGPPLRPPVLLPVLQAELHGDLDGGRAIVTEEDVVETDGRHTAQLLGQLRRRPVADASQRRVAQELGLTLQRGHQPGVVVTQRRRPPRAIAVDVTAAVRVVEARALGAHDHQRLDGFAVPAHLRVGMPDTCLVELNDPPTRGSSVMEFRHRPSCDLGLGFDTPPPG